MNNLQKETIFGTATIGIGLALLETMMTFCEPTIKNLPVNQSVNQLAFSFLSNTCLNPEYSPANNLSGRAGFIQIDTSKLNDMRQSLIGVRIMFGTMLVIVTLTVVLPKILEQIYPRKVKIDRVLESGVRPTEASDTTVDKICVICRDNFEHPSRVFSHTTTNGKLHTFHLPCITQWVDTQIEANSTPTCPECVERL